MDIISLLSRKIVLCRLEDKPGAAAAVGQDGEAEMDVAVRGVVLRFGNGTRTLSCLVPRRTGCHRVQSGCGSCPVSHRPVYSSHFVSASLRVGSCLLPPCLTPAKGMERGFSKVGVSEPLGLGGGPPFRC